MIVFDFTQFGGKHPEVAALKMALAHVGVAAPHTGQPYTEAMLFGLGGGLGFAYFLFEQSGTHPIHLGTRVHTKETERPEFFQSIARRIGVPLRVQNSSSATAAAANLNRYLERGQTPVISVDPVRLPYLGLSAAMQTYYCVVAYGTDEETGRVLLADRCPQSVSLTPEEFRAARETSWSPKYRTVVVDKAAGEPDPREVVTEGIHACCEQIKEGLGITNFGLRGMEKWATVLTSAKEKKSWPKIFSAAPALYEALYSMFSQISGRSGAGPANRPLYADFLEEASEILANPGLRATAENYREAGRMWDEVADAHLPSSVPLFAEAKKLTRDRVRLFETEGLEAQDKIQGIRQRLDEIANEAGAAFPLSFHDSRALLSDLRQRVLKLRDVEAEAARAMENAVGPCVRRTRTVSEPERIMEPSQPETVGS